MLQTVTGSLPGRDIAGLLAIGDRNGTFDVTYGVTRPGQGAAHASSSRARSTAGATSTYTLHLTSLAKAVAITRP